MNVPRLFVKLFIPTLMGLIFSAILNLADGIFVGKGVGSDAVARQEGGKHQCYPSFHGFGLHSGFVLTSIRLTLRNVGYMVKLGMSTFIGETAIVCMLIVGNFMFIKYPSVSTRASNRRSAPRCGCCCVVSSSSSLASFSCRCSWTIRDFGLLFLCRRC